MASLNSNSADKVALRREQGNGRSQLVGMPDNDMTVAKV
jgi:hypothetical protein